MKNTSIGWRCFALSYKPLCKAASLAKVFRCFSALKAFQHCQCPWRLQDGIEILTEDVSEVNDSFAVQTAGHNGSVCQNAELSLESIAIELLPLDFGVAVGPLETVGSFDEDLIPHSDSAGIIYPVAGNLLLQNLQRKIVFAVVTASVPKAEGDDGSDMRCAFGKVCNFLQISGEIFITAFFKAV